MLQQLLVVQSTVSVLTVMSANMPEALIKVFFSAKLLMWKTLPMWSLTVILWQQYVI